MEVFNETSRFWKDLSNINQKQLDKEGFDNFKRTVNKNYFDWGVSFKDPLFRSMFQEFIKYPTWDLFNVKFREKERIAHKLYFSMLYQYIKRTDKYGLLDSIEEPMIGNPSIITYNGKYISQDICHSIDEYNQIMNNIPIQPKNILEIGAGYGRLAYIFLKATDCRYIIVDIEPALSLSKRYLTLLFPDRKLLFLSPDEFKEQNDTYDLVLNVSSFHEMLPSTIKFYFEQINTKCEGYLYYKEWMQWRNPTDGVDIGIYDYPIYPEWEEIFSRKCKIQTSFFECLYKI